MGADAAAVTNAKATFAASHDHLTTTQAHALVEIMQHNVQPTARHKELMEAPDALTKNNGNVPPQRRRLVAFLWGEHVLITSSPVAAPTPAPLRYAPLAPSPAWARAPASRRKRPQTAWLPLRTAHA